MPAWVGTQISRRAHAFGMRVMAVDPKDMDRPEFVFSLDKPAKLLELLPKADVVVIACPLTAETKGMFGAEQFKAMRPTAYFINVGRGELVDQPALAAALRDSRLAGAGLDVFEVEPLSMDDPLLELDNVILTPHWSASTSDVWKATGRAMAEGMLRAARGEVPENIVNPEVLDGPEFRRKLSRFADNHGVNPTSP